MTPEIAFQLGSTAALVAWLLLVAGVIGPDGRSRRLLLFAGGRVIPVLLALGYLALLVAYWKSAPGGSFDSLDGVARLFSSRGKLAGGWLHFLTFDLLVGRWVIDEILSTRRPRWLLLPSLPLTFLYGPTGLLAHLALWAVGDLVVTDPHRPLPESAAVEPAQGKAAADFAK